MIQTINPYATARTAEIMSRYRPIAPKPESPSTTTTENDQNSNLPQSIRNSPYLRNVWAHLQARPTRTRKRGRTTAFAPPPPPINRTKTCLQGISPVFQFTTINSSPAKNLSIHGFGPSPNGIFSFVQVNSVGLDTAVTTLAETVAALPPLPCTTTTTATQIPIQGIDLNLEVENNQIQPKELDFMPQLKKPVKQSVIAPQPVRPIGSNIIVNSINEDRDRPGITAKKPEEVEKEVNEEEVPAIVSDSGNRVRLANSAYKEMVGQPECGWLDCVAASGGARRRIGGEVVLRFGDSSGVEKMSMMRGGFNCRVRIEWERNGGDKCCLDAFCSGVKILECEGKDYQFLWRFYTQDK